MQCCLFYHFHNMNNLEWFQHNLKLEFLLNDTASGQSGQDEQTLLT
jgi:hypothetical protein